MLNGVYSQLTIVFVSTLPTTTTSVVVQLPTPQTNVPQEWTAFVRSCANQGGFFLPTAGSGGVPMFVPLNLIVSVTPG
jgi:hypothetical protein